MKRIISISLLTIFAFLLPLSLFSDDTLHKAAYNGQIEVVKTILKSNINPDERDSFGGTALHAAMFQDNMEIVTLLIKAGLDVNAQGTNNKYTPLHDAVWANNLEAAKILINNGARTDIKSSDGFTPLQKALDENKKEIATYLKNIK